MMAQLALICSVVCILAVEVAAIPRGFNLAQLQKMNAKWKLPTSAKESNLKVKDLGELPTLHAVGLATNPANQNALLYADETALYEFDKTTGESTMVAGKEAFGLLAMRSSVDGIGENVAFKYITKVVARASGLYVFDYDRLRKYEYSSKEVSTVVVLSENQSENTPNVGTVSRDEKTVYWATKSGDGHLVMSLEIPNGKLSEAQFITGGPLIGHMELSSDEQYLLLADVDMALIEKVRISDGDLGFITEYGLENFYPGAMSMNEDNLYVINRATFSIDSYDISEAHPTATPLCNEASMSKITNPFDVAYDSSSKHVFVLDAANHPSLPTYVFSIKSISIGEDEGEEISDSDSNSGNNDYKNMLNFYSRWFAALNKS